MFEEKFIGTVPLSNIDPTVSDQPWKPVPLTGMPYSAVKPPSSAFFYLGSANTSMATVTPSGILYNSGVDLFRWDDNQVDIDRYITKPYSNYYRIFKLYPEHHHLKLTDPVFQFLPPDLQDQIRQKINFI